MNNINFIKPITRKERQSLQRWKLISLAASICTVIGISFTHYRTLQTAQELHSQKELIAKHQLAFDELTEQKKNICHKETCLVQELALLTNAQARNAQLLEVVTTIAHKSEPGCSLLSLQLEEQKFALTMACAHHTDATNALKHLQEISGIKTVSLTSLHNQAGAIVALFKGTLTA